MTKKFILFLALCAIPLAVYAAGSTERPQSLTDGLHVTGKTTDRWSFGGAAPSGQSAATVTPFKHLQNHGEIAPGTDYTLQHVTVSISAAEIIAMYTTPKTLIAAPGAGKVLAVQKVVFSITRTSTAFTGGGATIVQYGNTANGGGTQALDSTIASTVITGAAGTTATLRNGAVISDSTAVINTGLYLSNATAVFAAGTGAATVDVWYYVF